MDERPAALVHVSSAVVRVLDPKREAVIRYINALDGTEVVHAEGNKLIVVMESSAGANAGENLTLISGCEGVISAALVFEHIDSAERLGEIV
jgi:nitrate reductase NapD